MARLETEENQACLDEARRSLESGRSAGDYLRGLFEFGLTQSPSLKKRFDQHISPHDYKAIQLREVRSRELHRLPDKPSLDRFLSSQTGAYTSAWKRYLA